MGEMADDLVNSFWDDDEESWEENLAGDPVYDTAARPAGGCWMTEDDAARAVSGKLRRNRDMTRWRKPEKWVDFEDVLFKKRTEKSWLCIFPGGSERFVPISQTPEDFDPKEGSTGTLTVTEWIANKWDEEGEPEKEEPVAVEGVACLRETAAAIQVNVPGLDEPVWIPKSKVLKESEVSGDGDCGRLVLDPWIARQKGIGPDAPVSYENVAADVGRARERREGVRRPEPAPRASAAPSARQTSIADDRFGGAPDGDDDIPF